MKNTLYRLSLSIIIVATLCCCDEDNYYGNWAYKSVMNDIGRANSAVFTIDDNIYMVGGEGYYLIHKNFNSTWCYCPNGNYWNEMDSLPCSPRSEGVAFAIDGKGYFCGGHNIDNEYFDELFEFDPSKPEGSQWRLLESDPFPGGPFFGGIGFAANGFGYVGTGYYIENGYSKDYYKFDATKPEGSRWSKIDASSASKRLDANVFVIDDKAYILGGRHNGAKVNSMECLDASTDKIYVISSDMLKDYNVDILYRYNASSFSIGGKGYITCGLKFTGEVLRDTWEYTPDVNKGKGSWQVMGDFEGPSRYGAPACSVGKYGYILCGQNGAGSSSFKDDVWKFCPTEKYNRRYYK